MAIDANAIRMLVMADTTGAQASMGQLAAVTEKELKRAVANIKPFADAIREQERAAAKAAETMRKSANDEVIATHKVAEGHAGVNRELIVLAHEMSQGNYSRFGGSMMVLAERTNALEFAMTGAGAAALGTAAVLIGFVALVAKGAIESDKFARSLIATGNAAGLTADSYRAMSAGVADSLHMTYGKAAEAVAALAATGRISSGVMAEAARVTLELSHATGQTAEEVAADLAKMSDGAARWLEDHNKSMHAFSVSQYEMVKRLEDAGKAEDAQRIVLQAMDDQLKKSAESAGWFAKGMHAIAVGASEAAAAVKGIGAGPTLGTAQNDVRNQIEGLQTLQRIHRFDYTPQQLAGIEAQIQAYRSAAVALDNSRGLADKVAAAQADSAKRQEAGIAAQKFLDNLLGQAKATSALNKELDDYKKKLDAIRAAGGTVSAGDAAAGAAEIRKKFANPALKYVGAPNSAQSDFTTSEHEEQQRTNEDMRKAALEEQIKLEKILANIYAPNSPQAEFRSKELADQEKVNEALRQQGVIADEVARKQADLGMHLAESMKAWADAARDNAKNASEFVNKSMGSIEDALTNLVVHGKFSFKDLFQSIESDFVRMQIRQWMGGMLGGGSGGGAAASLGGLGQMSLLSAGYGALANSNFLGDALGIFPTFAQGINYVPYDGYPAILHEGERVTSKQDVSRASSPAVHIDFSGQQLHVGAGVNAQEMRAAMETNNAQVEMRLRRLASQGAIPR